MKQLLIRADDLGYSYAVNLGLARTVHEGLVRSVGVMPNMPETERGWSWAADADIAVGQHTNVCLGRPCAAPAHTPMTNIATVSTATATMVSQVRTFQRRLLT